LRSGIIGTKRFITKHLPPEKVVELRSNYQKPDGSTSSPRRNWPNLGRVVREAYNLEFSNVLAKKVLGWKPAYDFPQGAEITRRWLSFARLLPSDSDWTV